MQTVTLSEAQLEGLRQLFFPSSRCPQTPGVTSMRIRSTLIKLFQWQGGNDPLPIRPGFAVIGDGARLGWTLLMA